jgi:hypothetical protein
MLGATSHMLMLAIIVLHSQIEIANWQKINYFGSYNANNTLIEIITINLHICVDILVVD